MSLAGQVTTPLGADGLVAVSGGTDLEPGARGAVLLVDGLFRLDACPQQDTLRLVVRPLAEVETKLGGPSYAGAVAVSAEQLDRLAAMRPSRFELEVSLRRARRTGSARILLAALQLDGHGTTRVTAQAIVEPP
jgi:hypothetical protein